MNSYHNYTGQDLQALAPISVILGSKAKPKKQTNDRHTDDYFDYEQLTDFSLQTVQSTQPTEVDLEASEIVNRMQFEVIDEEEEEVKEIKEPKQRKSRKSDSVEEIVDWDEMM